MLEENLKNRLLVLRSTLRKACMVDGLSRLVLASVLGMLAGVLLDYFFFRWATSANTVFRCVMLASFVGLLGTILYKRIVAPLRIPLSNSIFR